MEHACETMKDCVVPSRTTTTEACIHPDVASVSVDCLQLRPVPGHALAF